MIKQIEVVLHEWVKFWQAQNVTRVVPHKVGDPDKETVYNPFQRLREDGPAYFVLILYLLTEAAVVEAERIAWEMFTHLQDNSPLDFDMSVSTKAQAIEEIYLYNSHAPRIRKIEIIMSQVSSVPV